MAVIDPHDPLASAILDALTEGVVVVNSDGAIHRWNPSFLALHRLPPATPLTFDWYLQGYALLDEQGQRIPLEDYPLLRALRGEVIRDLVLHTVHEGQGPLFVGSFNATPVWRDGQIACAVVTIRDITALSRERQARQRTEHANTQALHEARAASETSRRMLDALPTIAWALDAEGKVIYLNRAWYAYTGAGVTSTRDAIHPEDQARMAPSWGQALRERRAWAMPLRLRRHDGSYQWFASRVVPVEVQGEVVGWVGTSADVHEERAARDQLALIHSIARIGTFDWDIAQDIDRWSPELEALYGLAPGTFPGTFDAWRALVYPPDLPQALAAVQQSFQAGELNGEWRIVLPDGQVRWLAARGRVFSDDRGQPARLMGVNLDITERRLAEEELRHLNGTLEAQVQARTAELTDAYREMEAFTYSVAHDLRTPLRAIIATATILLEDPGLELPDEARRMLTTQQRSAHHMAQLVDDLLRLARLTRQPLRLQPVDLSVLAREVLGDLLPPAAAHHTLHIEEDLRARADPTLLRVVLQNLLDNALKFSPQGGRVELGREGDAFFVRDQGIGFDPTSAGQLFQPFHRLVRSDEYPGTGIGLATVRRIVERHGGSIQATSAPGQGTTFSFTLPPAAPS